jgi:hypothetical protein
MTDKRTWFAVWSMNEDGSDLCGYALDVYPEERLPYLRDLKLWGDQVAGEFASREEAEAAVLVAMRRACIHVVQ